MMTVKLTLTAGSFFMLGYIAGIALNAALTRWIMGKWPFPWGQS